jgi:hypothetical protein
MGRATAGQCRECTDVPAGVLPARASEGGALDGPAWRQSKRLIIRGGGGMLASSRARAATVPALHRAVQLHTTRGRSHHQIEAEGTRTAGHPGPWEAAPAPSCSWTALGYTCLPPPLSVAQVALRASAQQLPRTCVVETAVRARSSCLWASASSPCISCILRSWGVGQQADYMLIGAILVICEMGMRWGANRAGSACGGVVPGIADEARGAQWRGHQRYAQYGCRGHAARTQGTCAPMPTSHRICAPGCA